jgi:hypothetical protein
MHPQEQQRPRAVDIFSFAVMALVIRVLAACLLVLNAELCRAGDGISPRDEVMVLAASHLGARTPRAPSLGFVVSSLAVSARFVVSARQRADGAGAPHIPRGMSWAGLGRACQPRVGTVEILLVHVRSPPSGLGPLAGRARGCVSLRLL